MNEFCSDKRDYFVDVNFYQISNNCGVIFWKIQTNEMLMFRLKFVWYVTRMHIFVNIKWNAQTLCGKFCSTKFYENSKHFFFIFIPALSRLWFVKVKRASGECNWCLFTWWRWERRKIHLSTPLWRTIKKNFVFECTVHYMK